MWLTLSLTMIAFLLVTCGMAIGYIIKQKSLLGSCGGLNNLGIKKACDCDKTNNGCRRLKNIG